MSMFWIKIVPSSWLEWTDEHVWSKEIVPSPGWSWHFAEACLGTVVLAHGWSGT